MDSAHIPDVVRYRDGDVARVSDDVAQEAPLEIRVRGRAVSVTMRTPGHDDELAAGFLLTEGLIRQPDDVLRIEPCDRNDAGNLLNVLLAPEVHVDFDKLTRHVFASSSCGLCCKATIDTVRATFPLVESDIQVDAASLLHIPDAMQRKQSTLDVPDALHAAAHVD